MRLSKLSSAIQTAILHCPFHLSQAEERVVPDRRPPEKGLTALRPNDGAVAWLPLTSPPPSLWLLSAPLFFLALRLDDHPLPSWRVNNCNFIWNKGSLHEYFYHVFAVYSLLKLAKPQFLRAMFWMIRSRWRKCWKNHMYQMYDKWTNYC